MHQNTRKIRWISKRTRKEDWKTLPTPYKTLANPSRQCLFSFVFSGANKFYISQEQEAVFPVLFWVKSSKAEETLVAKTKSQAHKSKEERWNLPRCITIGRSDTLTLGISWILAMDLVCCFFFFFGCVQIMKAIFFFYRNGQKILIRQKSFVIL